MAKNVIYLDQCPRLAGEEYIFCCYFMKYSINVNYIQLINGAIQFNHILTIFRLLDLSFTNREALKFPIIIVDCCLLKELTSSSI